MLTDYGVFSRYDHTLEPGHVLGDMPSALTVRNAAGQDFYDLRNLIEAGPQPERAWLCIDPALDNLVVQAAPAIGETWPMNRRLVAVSPPPVNDLSSLVGHYRLNDAGEIVQLAVVTPPAPPAVTYKADIWRRATDAEAVTLEAMLAGASARLRGMYQDATVLSHGDPLFATMLANFTTAFGATRAAELLAPSA